MKVNFKYILIASAAVLAAVACNKETRPGYKLTGDTIEFCVTEAGTTKAMLDETSFATAGNQIVVYDYYTPVTGNAVYHINGDIATSNSSSWPFAEKHEWTQDGVHKFFGWLETDNNDSESPLVASEFFGSGFGFDANLNSAPVLTIPATTMSHTGTQFDFMYSDIHVRDLNTDKDFTPVPLEFSHLFTSFTLAAKDVAVYNDYIIDYVELTGLVVTNSATIDYSGDVPVVNYGTGTAGEAYRLEHAGGLKLGENLIDLATASISNRKYLLAWPQAARSMKLTIGYQAKDVSTEGTQYHSYTKTITIPYAWEAGKKNSLNLEFKDKEIALTYEVEPWNRIPEEIDFSDEVMVEDGAYIKWDEATVQDVDYKTGEVILFDDENIEATCTFTILTPKGATWTASLISKEGHPDAFRLVDGTKYGTVGQESTLKLVVTNQDPISPRHVCELLITVQTADGRTIVVDDALTPEEVDGVKTTYTRYKIIQNFIN